MKFPSRRMCIVASLGDWGRLLPDARAAGRSGADLLEIRADLFPARTLTPGALRDLVTRVKSTVRKPLLLTLRRRKEGGGLPRRFSETDRLALFRAAMPLVDAVDVEIQAVRICGAVVRAAKRSGRMMILSYHDFKKTPRAETLLRLTKRARRLGGTVLKVAVLPRSRADVERFMGFCARRLFPLQAYIAMGPLGKATRRAGFRWGSRLTYGYVRKPLAPGQMRVADLAKADRSKS